MGGMDLMELQAPPAPEEVPEPLVEQGLVAGLELQVNVL